jgi:hypothetical protein
MSYLIVRKLQEAFTWIRESSLCEQLWKVEIHSQISLFDLPELKASSK